MLKLHWSDLLWAFDLLYLYKKLYNKFTTEPMESCMRSVNCVIRFAHLHVRAFCFGRCVCRLSSAVCLSVRHQISETTRDTRQISSPLQEIGVGDQELDVRFCIGSS